METRKHKGIRERHRPTGSISNLQSNPITLSKQLPQHLKEYYESPTPIRLLANALDRRIQTHAGVRTVGSVFLTQHLKELLEEMNYTISTDE